MTKAFWFFSRNTNDGSQTVNSPSLPEITDTDFRIVVPCDIYKLGEIANHEHLLIGGFALQNDELGDGHTHLCARLGEDYTQITRGATPHTHPLITDPLGNLVQSWFLCFCKCSDAIALQIAAHPDCYPVVAATIDQDGGIGELDNEPWSAGDLATWQTRCLNLLGFALPPQIDRGKRLVQLFVNCLATRQADERALRFTY